MLEAKWKLDPIKGRGFNQVNAQQRLFDDHFNEYNFRQELDFLSKQILEKLSSSSAGLNNNDIYLLSLNNEFKASHANSVLKELIKNKKIKSFNPLNMSDFTGTGFGISYKDFKENNVKVIFKK